MKFLFLILLFPAVLFAQEKQDVEVKLKEIQNQKQQLLLQMDYAKLLQENAALKYNNLVQEEKNLEVERKAKLEKKLESKK